MTTRKPLRAKLATSVSKGAAALSRATGRGDGSVIGGRLGLMIDPNLLAHLANGRQIALISGTNGKTTTTRLATAAMGVLGSVATNSYGANMPTGHTSALAKAGDTPYAVLETDEHYLPQVLDATAPRVVALLNLSRDQLDRAKEVAMMAQLWRDTLRGRSVRLVANADDPMVVWAAAESNQVTWVAAGQRWHDDSWVCPECGGAIARAGVTMTAPASAPTPESIPGRPGQGAQPGQPAGPRAGYPGAPGMPPGGQSWPGAQAQTQSGQVPGGQVPGAPSAWPPPPGGSPWAPQGAAGAAPNSVQAGASSAGTVASDAMGASTVRADAAAPGAIQAGTSAPGATHTGPAAPPNTLRPDLSQSSQPGYPPQSGYPPQPGYPGQGDYPGQGGGYPGQGYPSPGQGTTPPDRPSALTGSTLIMPTVEPHGAGGPTLDTTGQSPVDVGPQPLADSGPNAPDADWYCTNCSLRRPTPQWAVDNDAVIDPRGYRHRVRLQLPGRVNRANAATALAVAAEFGVPPAEAAPRLAEVASIAGRYAQVERDGRIVRLLLAKNPAGWLEAFDMADPAPTLLSINARDPDGLDTSWLFDVDFSPLAGRPVLISGDRAFDLAVRLEVNGLPFTHVRSFAQALASVPPGRLEVIANYSAFQDIRAELNRVN